MMNQRGSLTVDFIFGLVLASGVSAILVALCFTLSIVEVAQYVAFSTSRVYFAAHQTEAQQIQRAEDKFKELLAYRSMKQLLTGPWFSVTYVTTGDLRSEYPPVDLNDSDTFYGTRLAIESKVLNMKIPFFGSVGSDNGFKSNINSFLGREPNFDECQRFEEDRWNKFRALNPTFQPSASVQVSDPYVTIMDNGC
ncbi:MAG: hypothetical protein AB7F59_04990 [Bdellovibrionales bacterium]